MVVAMKIVDSALKSKSWKKKNFQIQEFSLYSNI